MFIVLPNIDDHLRPFSLPNAPTIFFDVSQKSIRLQGSAQTARSLKVYIENLLKTKDLWKPSHSIKGPSTSEQIARSSPWQLREHCFNALAGNRNKGPIIFLIRANEDSRLLTAWHELVLPSLPNLLAKTVLFSKSRT